MSKYELKEVIGIIIISVINIAVAYLITSIFGISNVILYKSLTATQYVITYEVIIFFVLSLLESYFYHIKYEIKE